MRKAQRPMAEATQAALVAALLTSCGETSTGPSVARTIHRSTAVVVSDSLGVPAAGAAVQVVAEFDSAGLVPVVLATTDADGIASVVLTEGTWGVHAKTNARIVAGATFTIPGKTRAGSDTVMVRITLHTASAARGRALLLTTNHGGTVVGCPPAPSVSVTDSSGAYALRQLPLGHWTITMHHPGYALGLAEIDVTSPGDTVTVPDTHLAVRLP